MATGAVKPLKMIFEYNYCISTRVHLVGADGINCLDDDSTDDLYVNYIFNRNGSAKQLRVENYQHGEMYKTDLNGPSDH